MRWVTCPKCGHNSLHTDEACKYICIHCKAKLECEETFFNIFCKLIGIIIVGIIFVGLIVSVFPNISGNCLFWISFIPVAILYYLIYKN